MENGLVISQVNRCNGMIGHSAGRQPQRQVGTFQPNGDVPIGEDRLDEAAAAADLKSRTRISGGFFRYVYSLRLNLEFVELS